MTSYPRIAFIGAGSTIFMKNLVGDILLRPSLKGAHVALMDIDEERLNQSAAIAEKLIASIGVPAKITKHLDRKEALDGADFVITAFQVGGYDPCTKIDFDVPKEFGLRQTIADTLGIGGIMRALRTVPHLWDICEDMLQLCPNAILLQYVNPMAINIWAVARKYPEIKQVGLCHSVQYTAQGLAYDLGIPIEKISYKCAGINHIAFFTEFNEIMEDGSYRDLYPALHEGYAQGRFPNPEFQHMPRCPNKIRYEMMKKTGYYVTESSEHFAEYVPWFIKEGREDLIKRFEIPLDEYPARCIEQIAEWKAEYAELANKDKLEIEPSHEYASDIVESVWTGKPSVIYGNLRNDGLITNLPDGCAVEVPCLIDRNGIQPTFVGDLPPQLTAIMQSNVTVQGLVVEALMTENPEHIYHAAMMDPHTAAELDLDQIWALVDRLREAHGEWLPAWARAKRKAQVA